MSENKISFEGAVGMAIALAALLIDPQRWGLRLLVLLASCGLLLRAASQIEWVRGVREELSLTKGIGAEESYSLWRLCIAILFVLTLMTGYGVLTWPSEKPTAVPSPTATTSTALQAQVSPPLGVPPSKANGMLPPRAIPVVPSGNGIKAPPVFDNPPVRRQLDWHDKKNWRENLKIGMTRTDVRYLFGQPERISVIEDMEFWEWGIGGEIVFDMKGHRDGSLYSWYEPR
jgi:hypothetical protein